MKEVIVKTEGHNGTQFPEHAMAHTLFDNLPDIFELGPASHNHFGIWHAKAVAPEDDFEFFKGAQVRENGKYIEIDVWGEAANLPFEDNSQDVSMSSHADEHFPNLFKTFEERTRVLRNGGYVFMILPQRDALPSDAGRPLSTYKDVKRAYDENWTPDTAPADVVEKAGGNRGHYWVFTSDSLKEIIDRWSEVSGNQWELFYEEDPDKKVGNGFLLVYKVIKPEPVVEPVAEEPEPPVVKPKPAPKPKK